MLTEPRFYDHFYDILIFGIYEKNQPGEAGSGSHENGIPFK